MNISFILCGQRLTNNEKLCNPKPSFFEAILLSKNYSCSPAMKGHSQPIRIEQPIYFIKMKENISNFKSDERKLELLDQGRNLTEEEAYEIFSKYVYVEDRKVSYLLLNDKKKIRQRKKKELHHLKEEVKI